MGFTPLSQNNNNPYNIFISELPKEDSAPVQKQNTAITKGKSLLNGWTFAIKDNINVQGSVASCASKILVSYISLYTATAVSRIESEGAVIRGKANMDEFAMGSSSETSGFGPVKNPRNPAYVPGGSSGGSAAAVASGAVRAALGSDTGGSVRLPASFCGITGLKPTYGRVSRFGLVAFASSLDQIGPLTNNVRDAAAVLEAISGHDQRDSTSSTEPVPSYSQKLSVLPSAKAIGLPDEYFGPEVDAAVKEAIYSAAEHCERAGIRKRAISLDSTKYCMPVYYIISSAEASSNLARYTGIIYGNRAENQPEFKGQITKNRTELLGREVKRRIMMGTYVLSRGYQSRLYVQAQRLRRIIADDFRNAFSQVDYLFTPTSPTGPFPLGRKKDPLKMYRSDIYTAGASLAGLPAISIPCGNDRNGLPIGLQIIARPFDEAGLLSLANYLEKKIGYAA